MDSWERYYLLDWVAMLFAFASVYLLGNRKRVGFVLFILSNFVWIAVGFLADSSGMIGGNLIFLFINARGWLKWKSEEGEVV